MKNHIKKVVAMALSVVMLSTMGLGAYAADSVSIDDAVDVGQSIEIDLLDQSPAEISLGDQVNFAASGIEETVLEQDVATMAENRPPVAELRVAVLNPDSMINGKFTTNTQIAWLWSYNGQDFTYDPDGDTLVNAKIGGISNSDFIGDLAGNIGFATQFKTAAQYTLTFQVQDSRGAWSNIAQYTFSIEPADGNTRPVCKIGISADKLVPNQVMLISWANSADNDAGDKISDTQILLFKDGVEDSLNDYLVQRETDSVYVAFPEVGSYQMWARVVDSHNAWSDWVIFTVNVEAAVISNISINGVYEPSSTEAYWVDNFAVMDVDEGVLSFEEAKVLCESFGSHNFPSALPSKLIIDNRFSVSGRITTASGTPVANTRVQITMPLTLKRGLDKTVFTDSNGNFSYNPTSKEFWVDTRYYRPGQDIDFLHVGDWGRTQTQYIRFSRSYGTNFLYPTSITVSASGQTYSENVTCEVGYTKDPVIGHSMYFNGMWTVID